MFVTSIRSENNAEESKLNGLTEDKSFLEEIKSNKLILGGLVFGVVVLIYFVGLNFLDPSDTEIVFEQGNTKNELKMVEQFAVDISGAVKNPGVYEVEEGSRVIDVVSKADGLSALADEDWVTKSLNLSSFVSDQQKIYVPFEWESTQSLIGNLKKFPVGVVSSTSESEKEVVTNNQTVQQPVVSVLKLNVNQASKGALEELSGIGDAYAQRIIDNRPYSNLDDLKSKTGIPQTTIDKIIEKITFE